VKFSVTIGQQQALWAQRALGLFVVLWLNVAVQPCAIAMVEGDDHDCPHCPPAHTEHHDRSAIDAETMPCASGAADCGVADDLNHDGRPVQLKLKDAPTDTPAAMPVLGDALIVARTGETMTLYPSRSPPPGASCALNILYCVYLD
jgi:hypothetical protein